MIDYKESLDGKIDKQRRICDKLLKDSPRAHISGIVIVDEKYLKEEKELRRLEKEQLAIQSHEELMKALSDIKDICKEISDKINKQ